jgi:hypothetical protein
MNGSQNKQNGMVIVVPMNVMGYVTCNLELILHAAQRIAKGRIKEMFIVVN